MRAEDDSPSEPRMILRAVIRAERESGARRVFAKLQRYLGRSLAIQTIEPYRKDPQCFDVHAIAALPDASKAEVVYALLRDTGDLRGRAIGGPSEYAGGRWEMHLIFWSESGAESISHIPGLVWLNCNVGNVV